MVFSLLTPSAYVNTSHSPSSVVDQEFGLPEGQPQKPLVPCLDFTVKPAGGVSWKSRVDSKRKINDRGSRNNRAPSTCRMRSRSPGCASTSARQVRPAQPPPSTLSRMPPCCGEMPSRHKAAWISAKALAVTWIPGRWELWLSIEKVVRSQ